MAPDPSQHEGHDIRVNITGAQWCYTCQQASIRARKELMEAVAKESEPEPERPRCACSHPLDYPGSSVCINCRVSQLSRGMLSADEQKRLAQAVRLKVDRREMLRRLEETAEQDVQLSRLRGRFVGGR